MDPELRSVYEDANKSYSRYIRSKGDIEKLAGSTKLKSTPKRGISDRKIASKMQSGAEDDQIALQEAVKGVSPGGTKALKEMSENVQSRDALQKLGEDRAVLSKGGLAVPIPKLGYVGVTPLAGAKAYTLVRDWAAKPALTAAVRALEVSGRPITIESVRALANQYGVDEQGLADTLRQGGALKE
jgi:hypothetical protein